MEYQEYIDKKRELFELEIPPYHQVGGMLIPNE